MKATKTNVETAIRALNTHVPAAVKMQQEIDTLLTALHAEKQTIRTLLDSAGATAWPCADGSSAVLVAEERMTWNLEKLQEEFDQETFEKFCPRKPDGPRLRAMLDATNERDYAKALRKCAKVTKSSRLELRAPAAEIVKDSKSEAAA